MVMDGEKIVERIVKNVIVSLGSVAENLVLSSAWPKIRLPFVYLTVQMSLLDLS